MGQGLRQLMLRTKTLQVSRHSLQLPISNIPECVKLQVAATLAADWASDVLHTSGKAPWSAR
jgi:hypothetical protein